MYPKKDTSNLKMWFGYMEPFRIMKKIYFIGGYQASIHMIDTGDGLVLFDTGFAKQTFATVDGIYRFGFRPEDVKYIFLSHWHVDHTEGIIPLLAVCKNAKTVIGIRDDIEVKSRGYCDPDIIVKDNDTITLGNITFRFLETPGHTIGTISIFFDYTENGKTYTVGTFGGAGIGSIIPDDCDYYDGAQDDYFDSLNKLEKENVDIFIGNHCWNNNTDEKAKQLLENPNKNPFIDSLEFSRFIKHCKNKAKKMIEEYNANH